MSELLLLERPLHHAPPAAGRTPPPAAPASIDVLWARHADEVLAAQRLRYEVFAVELGAELQPLPGTPAGHDADMYDAHCEHLIARTQATAQAPARVVGTYRVLMPGAARRLGRSYTDAEFDLAPLAALRPRLAELGRACVAPEYRAGSVVLMMWARLIQHMAAHGLLGAIGGASLPMADGGHGAASLWHRLRSSHLVEPALQVRPRLPLPVQALRHDLPAAPPPLVRGYLKCGARVLGAPAWDPAFHSADLPMLLRLADLPDSYRRRFLGR